MRDVEALGDGFVFVAVAHHPLGFGLGFLCDVEEKDAREEENNTASVVVMVWCGRTR